MKTPVRQKNMEAGSSTSSFTAQPPVDHCRLRDSLKSNDLLDLQSAAR